MNNDSAQQMPCDGAIRGLTVDRIIARLRAVEADGARVVNLRCAVVNAGCDDLAMPSTVGPVACEALEHAYGGGACAAPTSRYDPQRPALDATS